MRDVGAEHATQHVQLVDDDVVETRQEGGPPGMAGKHGRMQHLGVGEHHVGGRAHPRTLLGGRVAVVGAGYDLGKLVRSERTELVLGERLGGEQQQRSAGVARASCSFGDGDLIAARLARCGAGGNDHRVPGTNEVDGLGLMGEEPLMMQRVEHALADRGNGVGEPSGPCGLMGNVGEPAIGGQLVDEIVEVVAPMRRRIRNRVFQVEVDDCHTASIAPGYDKAVHQPDGNTTCHFRSQTPEVTGWAVVG